MTARTVGRTQITRAQEGSHRLAGELEQALAGYNRAFYNFATGINHTQLRLQSDQRVEMHLAGGRERA